MTPTIFAAMLVAAALHASWNAWIKSRSDPYGAMVALGIGAGWPCLFLLAWQGIPKHTAWGWIVATALSVFAVIEIEKALLRLFAGNARR